MKRSLQFFSLIFGLICITIAIPIAYRNNQNIQRNKYNLILISVDTLRPDHMSVYGYPKKTTPNIDEWAKNAVVFTNATTIVAETYPSFMSLMTGKYPITSRVINHVSDMSNIDPISNYTPTLAKELKQKNFSTAAFVVHAQLDSNLTNISKGFDIYKSGYLWDVTRQSRKQMVRDSIDWIEKQKNNRFFMWVHLINPHYPYNPPDEFKCKYNENYCQAINNKTPLELESERQKIAGCDKGATQDQIEMYKTLYDGEIAYSDSLLKDLFVSIKKNNFEKNTLIVFYSDHGHGFDHNFNFQHGMMYDSNTKIALIMKHPQFVPSQQKNNTLIQNVDIFPTILKLLNIDPIPNLINAVNFSSIFERFNLLGNLQKRKYSYSFTTKVNSFSVFDGTYKYIFTYDGYCIPGKKQEQLFNLKTDSHELNNIVNDNKELALKLKTNLFTHFEQFNLPPIYKNSLNTPITRDLFMDKLKSLGY